MTTRRSAAGERRRAAAGFGVVYVAFDLAGHSRGFLPSYADRQQHRLRQAGRFSGLGREPVRGKQMRLQVGALPEQRRAGYDSGSGLRVSGRRGGSCHQPQTSRSLLVRAGCSRAYSAGRMFEPVHERGCNLDELEFVRGLDGQSADGQCHTGLRLVRGRHPRTSV
jgi:hypothetical protein